MRRALWITVLALSCGPATPSTRTGSDEVATDSVVLERTRCFGTCPAYRLRVSRTGEVVFASENPGDQRTTASDTVAAWVVDSLAAEANRTGFLTLPDSVVPGAPLCENVATDHPTITIGLFGASTKRVVYYTGCHLAAGHAMAPVLRDMQSLATRIDSLTGAGQWIRPAGRK